MERVAGEINTAYKREVIKVEIRDSYYNMYEQVAPHEEYIERAKAAMLRAGVTPASRPSVAGRMAPASLIWDCLAPTSSRVERTSMGSMSMLRSIRCAAR